MRLVIKPRTEHSGTRNLSPKPFRFALLLMSLEVKNVKVLFGCSDTYWGGFRDFELNFFGEEGNIGIELRAWHLKALPLESCSPSFCF
jgi:hypothetical protein